MRQWCGIQLRGPRSVSFVPTANSNTVEMFAVCVCVCVCVSLFSCCSSLSQVCVYSFSLRGLGLSDVTFTHGMSTSYSLHSKKCKNQLQEEEGNTHIASFFSASTCEGRWNKRRVFPFTGRKTASRSHKLHLEKWFSSKSDRDYEQLLFFYLQHKDQKETSWGECEWVLWESNSGVLAVGGMFCICRVCWGMSGWSQTELLLLSTFQD